MTRDDDFIGQLEAYLDEYEGMTPLPDAIRDTIRAELPKTKQIGPVSGLVRFSPMNSYWKFGIAAAVVVAAALISFGFINNQVGPDAGTPTPIPSGSPAGGDLPEELRYVFLGPARVIEGLPEVQAASIDFSGPRFFYQGGRELMTSDYSLAGPGQIRLVAIRTGSSGCGQGDEGIYPYTLSAGGTMLTFGAGTDDCAARATALPGEWLRSDCKDPSDLCIGNLEAGTYQSSFFEPLPEGQWQARFGALSYSVPDGWANYLDSPNSYGLTTQADYAATPGTECYDCPGTRDAVTVLGDPGPATLDCLETMVEGVGTSASALANWLFSHPGLVATEPQSVTVGGRPATSLGVEPATDWTGTCDETNPFRAVPIFFREEGYHWALPAGDRWQVTLVDLEDGHTVVIVVDTDPGDLEAFIQETQDIVASFTIAPR